MSTNSTDLPGDVLNRAQRTNLAVTLSGFEHSLRQAASWLDGDEPQGVMYRASLALAPTMATLLVVRRIERI